MQADTLAGLLRELGMAPAVIAGGSGGSRVSMLTAARHPDVASALAVWWISGGVLGLISLGYHYCSDSIRAAWNGGMAAVVELPEWQEVLERNPSNRDRMLELDPQAFIATMERWMLVYCPCGDEVVPGLSAEDAAAMQLPTLVFRGGRSDINHPRATSEAIAAAVPGAAVGGAAVGRHASGSTGRRHAPRASRSSGGGRCSPPRSSTGPATSWPEVGDGGQASASVAFVRAAVRASSNPRCRCWGAGSFRPNSTVSSRPERMPGSVRPATQKSSPSTTVSQIHGAISTSFCVSSSESPGRR